MSAIFRTPERDAALDHLLSASLGAETWRLASLRAHVEPDADLLFPGGPVEMIEAWFDLGDRRTAAHAASEGVSGMPRLTARVRALVLHRVSLLTADLDAARRAVAILALPGHGAAAPRSLARTTDTIWRAAGDRSADFSWYTKRATLGAIHAATVLYALGGDRSEDEIAAFLDRRLARAAAVGRGLRRRGAPQPSATSSAPLPSVH